MNIDSENDRLLINKALKLLLGKLTNCQLIYLFGSYATGNNNKNSDIDIAVLNVDKMDAIKRWNIESELANLLKCDVDLVDLLTASTVMQHEVIQQGQCLYNPFNKQAQFEIQVMSMYQHLNIERASIVKSYIK